MIKHPLSVGMKIEANKPQCPCKGASFKLITGTILKVITNHTGHWYYLDLGITVKDQWVTKVIK